MRLIALTSWYDEPVESLVACLSALAEHHVDHVVALDGAYALYPGGKAASPADQHAAVVLACRELGLGLTLHVPQTVWAGNEVEKRTALFAAGWAVADEGDWFWVQDADQITVKSTPSLKARLQTTDLDAAEVEFLDVVALRANQPDWPARFPVRSLFRAQPIHLETNHITYVAGDGRLLWGYEDGNPIVPALDLTADVVVEHRPDRRPNERQIGKMQYYAQRDAERVERGDCARCGQRAVRLVPTRWRMTKLGPVADWLEACEQCADRAERVNRRTLLQLGVNPDSFTVENRNGRAPAGMTA